MVIVMAKKKKKKDETTKSFNYSVELNGLLLILIGLKILIEHLGGF